MRTHFLPFLQRIPEGKVATYKTLAEIFAVHPRTVARMLSKNHDGDTYPCYRVIHESGKIGGYTHPLGIQEKKRRLHAHQVVVSDDMVNPSYIWHPHMTHYSLSVRGMLETVPYRIFFHASPTPAGFQKIINLLTHSTVFPTISVTIYKHKDTFLTIPDPCHLGVVQDFHRFLEIEPMKQLGDIPAGGLFCFGVAPQEAKYIGTGWVSLSEYEYMGVLNENEDIILHTFTLSS